MGKTKTTVHIESDVLQALRKVAEADERPMAYHHNRALRAYGPIKKLVNKAIKVTSKEVAIKGSSLIIDDLLSSPNINSLAWAEWASSPTSKITKESAKKQLKLLAGYSMADQQSIIDASINSGWQGLFPLKGVQKPAEGSFTDGHTDESWRDGI
jgi:hypothetical protein